VGRRSSQRDTDQNPACAPSGHWPTKDSFIRDDGRFSRSSICVLHLIIAISFFFCGCTEATRIRPEAAEAVDLTDRFLAMNPVAPDAHFDHLQVTRKGRRRDALVLVAPISVRASLRGASGKMILEGWATPVFNIGDGIQMNLFIKHAGMLRPIADRYFDSGRRAEDRDWVPIAIPLELGKDDQLEIGISAGPQGDLVADWLALSSLRLVRREPEP